MMITGAKNIGVMAELVALNFVCRRVQPYQNRVHAGYDYLYNDDPTRMCKDHIGWTECLARFQRIFHNVQALPKAFMGWHVMNPVTDVNKNYSAMSHILSAFMFERIC